MKRPRFVETDDLIGSFFGGAPPLRMAEGWHEDFPILLQDVVTLTHIDLANQGQTIEDAPTALVMERARYHLSREVYKRLGEAILEAIGEMADAANAAYEADLAAAGYTQETAPPGWEATWKAKRSQTHGENDTTASPGEQEPR